MRTFIALELPQEFVDQTAQLARALRSSVHGRFMKPETYHLTLAFLGEIGESEVASAMAALDSISELPAVPLEIDGLGSFGRKREHTLYLALQRVPEAISLAEELRNDLSSRDVAFDAKKFVPHITLARRAQLPQDDFGSLPFPTSSMATRVTLFKSILSQEGATYKPLYSVELQQ